jgi:hypothetical protein
VLVGILGKCPLPFSLGLGFPLHSKESMDLTVRNLMSLTVYPSEEWWYYSIMWVIPPKWYIFVGSRGGEKINTSILHNMMIVDLCSLYQFRNGMSIPL